MAMVATVPARSEVAAEHTWNAPSVYESPEAWKTALEAAQASLPSLQHYAGQLGDSPALLAEAIEAIETLQRRVYKLYFYAAMTQACDTNDQAANAMVGQAGALYGQSLGATAFLEPELLAIGKDTLSQWLKQEPKLAVYEHYLDNLFRRQQHVRSAEVEELLGMLADPFGTVDNTAEMLTNADIQFRTAISSSSEPVEVTQGTITALYVSPDRETRRTAFESYTDGYLAFRNTLASNLGAAIKRDVFYTRARRYSSSLEASLFANNIPVAVFHNLVETYRRNIPTWHRYWAVRRKALGVDELFPYDILAPIAQQQPTVTYPQAVDWISQGMQPLGDEYVTALRRGCLDERWVDVYPNKGKRQGAFSFGAYDTYPFIMMSFTGDLNSMSTLAHELGHSMHSYFTRKAQPYIYGDYSLFVAEVASNFNQAMVRANLMKTQTDPNFQIALIEEAMYNFRRYFFIMPTLARFELEMHERAERGEGLTADDMNSLMLDLFSEGYGSELNPLGERTGITWATFGHLYANFYVFQYATGISAAHALSEKILKGSAGAAERYLQFLKSGSSLYPIDALKLAGVEMTTPEAVETTFAVLAGYVDRLEQLVG
jgi:oligoendopeptidase F